MVRWPISAAVPGASPPIWLGLDAFGIDLSPEMIRLARAAHPGRRYEVGTMEELRLGDGTLSGLSAWYSIIHLPPERLPGALAEFGRVLRADGHLLLAFQTADEPLDIQPHDHKGGQVLSLVTTPDGGVAAAVRIRDRGATVARAGPRGGVRTRVSDRNPDADFVISRADAYLL
jgi:SAM-dependent methyltransferase